MDAPTDFDDLLYGYGSAFSNFEPVFNDSFPFEPFEHHADVRSSQPYHDIEDQSGSACVVVRTPTVELPMEAPLEPISAPKVVQPAPPPKPEVRVTNRLVKRTFGPNALRLPIEITPMARLDEHLSTSRVGDKDVPSTSRSAGESPESTTDEKEYDTDMLTTHLCRAFDVKGYESAGSFARDGLVLSGMLSRGQVERCKFFDNGNRAFEDRLLKTVQKNRERNARLEEEKLEAEALALEADLLSEEHPESPVSSQSSKLDRILNAKTDTAANDSPPADSPVPAPLEQNTQTDANFGIPPPLETMDFIEEWEQPPESTAVTSSEMNEEEVLEEPVSFPITPPGMGVAEPDSFPCASTDMALPEIKMEEEEIDFLERATAATNFPAGKLNVDEDEVTFVCEVQSASVIVAPGESESQLSVASPKECDAESSDDENIDMEPSGTSAGAQAVDRPQESSSPIVTISANDDWASESLLTDEDSALTETTFSNSQIPLPRPNAELPVVDIPSAELVQEVAPTSNISPKTSGGPSTSQMRGGTKSVSNLPLKIPHKVIRKPRNSRPKSRSGDRSSTKSVPKPDNKKVKLNSGISSPSNNGPPPSPGSSSPDTSRRSGRSAAPRAPPSQVQVATGTTPSPSPGSSRRSRRSLNATNSAVLEAAEFISDGSLERKITNSNSDETEIMITSVMNRPKKTAEVVKDEKDAWVGWHRALVNQGLNISEDEDEELD